MSYQKTNPTIRRPARLDGLGDASSCGPNQQWDPNASWTNPVYPYNTIKGQCVAKTSTPAPSSGGGFWETLTTIGGKIGDAVLSNIGGSARAQGASTAYQQAYASQQGGTPSWVIPAAIGGVAVVAALVLTRKK